MGEESRPFLGSHREIDEEEDGAPLKLTPSASVARKVAAEFIGTFMLLFTAAATPIVNKQMGGLSVLALSLTPGVAVTIIISSTAHICGAHLNPAVTISFAALGQFPWTRVPIYIVTQVLGSVLASFALKVIYAPDIAGGVTIPAGSDAQAFVLELIISFILMFVVTAVSTDKLAVGQLAGVAVGTTVFLNNLVASQATGASMNPVRTLGPAIASGIYKGIWIYMVAPPIGCLLGAASYSLVRLTSQTKPPN